MRASCLRCSALLLALAPFANAQDAAQLTESLYASHDLAGALEASRSIADPSLRAEWEFQILFTGGDLPGAMAAALRGLESSPNHVSLLHNSVTCAVQLGLGDLSTKLVARWGSAIDSPDLDPTTRAREAEALARMAPEARHLIDLENAAHSAIRRAKTITLALLAATLAALTWLTLRPRA